MSANAATKFARRLETDISTIELNRTHVGFSHGSDTFGWRFMPRVQTPPSYGTLQTIAENIGGGPTPDQDMRDRKLEPGIRECTALVVMPSFVSYATFETRSNWFGLTNPRKRELTMHDTMKLSRSHHAIHKALCDINDCDSYRPGDVAHLSSVVEQLDRKMPLQHMTVQIPYENMMGGFEMFNSGVADLGPQLDGWYGASGIRLADCSSCDSCESAKIDGQSEEQKAVADKACRCQGTTLFLVGANFSVQDTRVIAGGKCIPDFTLLSRDVIQVTIPSGVYPLEIQETDEDGNKKPLRRFIDIHLATPYGVTDHLLVPVYAPLKEDKKPKKEETPKPSCRPLFSSIWSFHHSNLIAVQMVDSVEYHSTIAMSMTLNLTPCPGELSLIGDHSAILGVQGVNVANRYVVAKELANRITKEWGDPEELKSDSIASKLKNRKGIVYFNEECGVCAPCNHIDLWNGSAFASPQTPSPSCAESVLFWEILE